MSAATLALVLWAAGVANADAMIGTTTQPAGSAPSGCTGPVTYIMFSTDPSTPFTVPAGGGQITSWSTNTASATAGATAALVVLRPTGSNTYTITAVDSRTLPTPLPASHVATFTLATPISVNAGDTIGVYGPSAAATCYWSGGSTPSADMAAVATTSPSASPPAAGQAVSNFGPSPPGVLVNVSATVTRKEDAGVTTSSAPARPSAGNLALLSSTVTNHGPGLAPITFTDAVPAGLTINSALAGNGSCTVSGQTVTCTISGLAAGASAPVNVVATPTKAGSYANRVAVAPLVLTDPNPANNTASTTLSVAPPSVTTACVVPKLRGTPVGAAKRVLKLLGCKVKVKRVRGNQVAKGTVVKTKPKAGTYAFGRKVTLVVQK